MFVTLSDEMEVKVAASDAWDVYSGLGYSEIGAQQLPEMFDRVDVLRGDGGVGTVLLVTFPPDATGHVSHYKEKFTVIDDKKRVKVAEGIEGGILDQGVDQFRVRFQVIEKQRQEEEEEEEEEGEDSCIIKVKVQYETDDLTAAMNAVSSLQSTRVVMEAVADYLTKRNVQVETN